MNRKRMTLAGLSALLFCLSLLPLSAIARTDELIEPDPFTPACSLPTDKLQTAIVTAAAIRGWMVVDKTPNNMELKYVKGDYKHVLVVNVSYHSNRIAVTYKDSTNLDYKVKKNGVRYLHPRPIGWMQNLSGDIQRSIEVQCSQ
jgi:hypothetical protein